MSSFILINDLQNDDRTAFFRELIPEELDSELGLKLIGAVSDEGYPDGAVIFNYQGWSVHILYIEVYPEVRRQGLGTALLDTLMKYLEQIEHPYVVEANYTLGEDSGISEEAHAFFRSLPDFEVVSGGQYCVVTTDTVWNSNRLKLLETFTCNTKCYLELTAKEKNDLLQYLASKNMKKLIDWDETTIIPELSLCNAEEGVCNTLVVFRRSEMKRTLELSFLMCRPEQLDKLSGLLNEVIKRLKTMYPRHNLVFSLINKEAELIAKRFFAKDIKVQEIYEAVSYGRVTS